jgi:hypothetical protein
MGAYLEAHPDEAQDVVDKLKKGEIADGAVAATVHRAGADPDHASARRPVGSRTTARPPTILRTSSAFALVDRADVGVTLAARCCRMHRT